jgi:sugar phosphate isomerase/epimerase
MRIGVFTALYSDLPLGAVLDKLAGWRVECVELGAGNYPGAAHIEGDVRRAVAERGMTISALSQHGNPLHPDAAVATAHHETWRRTLELAERLEVDTVIAFSGCPGDGPGASAPNWVTCAWPDDYPEVLAWQWEERVLPYWTREAEVARSHGVRVAVEPHAGFVVYSPETLLRLREATGPALGANYDPSHLFWQGIDPVLAIERLGEAIFHVHAKDTRLEPELVARRGVLETASFSEPDTRAWNFATVGDGHGEDTWTAILEALRATGYDGAISLEHEDPRRGRDEGVARGVEVLRRVLHRVA